MNLQSLEFRNKYRIRDTLATSNCFWSSWPIALFL